MVDVDDERDFDRRIVDVVHAHDQPFRTSRWIATIDLDGVGRKVLRTVDRTRHREVEITAIADVGRVWTTGLRGRLILRLQHRDLGSRLGDGFAADGRQRDPIDLGYRGSIGKREQIRATAHTGCTEVVAVGIHDRSTSVRGVVEDIALVEDTRSTPDRGLVIPGAEVESRLRTEVRVGLVRLTIPQACLELIEQRLVRRAAVATSELELQD